MKYLYVFIFYLLVVLCCSSPMKDPPDNLKPGYTTPEDHYINAFVKVTGVSFVKEIGSVENLHFPYDGDPFILVELNGERIADKEADSLRLEVGDTAGVYYGENYRGPIIVTSNSFSGISVYSDTPFNDFQPGESLAGIINMRWSSALPVIKSKQEHVSHSFSKLLSEVIPEDLYLISPRFTLSFTETPAIKEHNITVSFMDKDTTITGTGHFVFK